ncbi:hypothetical protein [Kitasatospora sp. NPDC057198]|uniref:hypothetical protein n=1 Tax=Kitasatospora sp. NPDC057198 TaxID=3346046 RepID=UPI00363609F3
MLEASTDGGGGGTADKPAYDPITGGIVEAVQQTMRALASQVGASAVKVEIESLQTFKSRVDGILATLNGSAAGQGTISQQQLAPGQLGRNFGQAGDLMTAYATVHGNLEQLSRTLSLQIEAMSASIDMAARGYDNADAEQQQRFHSILNEAGSQAGLAPVGAQYGRTGQQPGVPLGQNMQGSY